MKCPDMIDILLRRYEVNISGTGGYKLIPPQHILQKSWYKQHRKYQLRITDPLWDNSTGDKRLRLKKGNGVEWLSIR